MRQLIVSTAGHIVSTAGHIVPVHIVFTAGHIVPAHIVSTAGHIVPAVRKPREECWYPAHFLLFICSVALEHNDGPPTFKVGAPSSIDLI